MPKRVPAKTKTWICPKCGTQTKASRRSGRLYEHTVPASSEACPMSGQTVLNAAELENSYECACGTWTRVSTKGTLYDHHMPDGDACPLSREPIGAAPPRPTVTGILRIVPPAPTNGWAKPVTSGRGSSVYATPAGLPGLGLRR